MHVSSLWNWKRGAGKFGWDAPENIAYSAVISFSMFSQGVRDYYIKIKGRECSLYHLGVKTRGFGSS